jgi:lipopolysaccharide/colanic/teichoic acid biosynthesis glycosyltransferase
MYKKYLKRLCDVIFSVGSLPILLLIIIFFAPIIRISDKGPIFYRTKRIGLNGQLFIMYKLRSMYVNVPDIRLADGSTYNGENDIRVTPVGRIMRKTSIDEVPQFINILLGQMSLIGPRPDPPDWINKYPEDIRVFLTVRPGITGYNQAYFRNRADGIEKMKNDAYYATHCTLLMDVKVFFKTIAIVLKRENTYKDTSNDFVSINRSEYLRK